MSSLKRIEIGIGCFKNVRVFEIENMVSLESVAVGNSSFYITNTERSDGKCRICSCPNLKDISFLGCSFADFKYFEISNLKSLQTLFFFNNFYWADFSLQRTTYSFLVKQ